jgi:alpha/beta superfamily hydrolase
MAAPKAAQQPEKILIYFGGRMEDAWWAPKMASYLEGWTIYTFNYRGFGDSNGACSERNAKADAMAIFEFVKKRHAHEDTELSLMGRSLGTGIAIWLAHRVKPDKLVLISPFCSIRSVLLNRRWLAPLSILAGKRFSNSQLVSEISAPTLAVLAEHDHEIAHAESLKLARKFAAPPMVVIVGGTTHKSLPRSVGTQRVMSDFLMNTETRR